MARIYYDESRDSLFIEGSNTVYPDRSLQASVEGDTVSVWIANTSTRVAGPFRFDQVQDMVGNSFQTLQGAVDYLQAEFLKNDRNTTEAIQTEFATASDVWDIPHNLGRRPASVEVYVGGCLVEASLVHISDNLLRVNFSSPQTGYVTII